MLALVIGGAIIVCLAASAASDSEFVQYVKEAIYWLVKAGYGIEKIVQIMHFYVDY